MKIVYISDDDLTVKIIYYADAFSTKTSQNFALRIISKDKIEALLTFQMKLKSNAGVKLTNIVGPTMWADKSWTIWHSSQGQFLLIKVSN